MDLWVCALAELGRLQTTLLPSRLLCMAPGPSPGRDPTSSVGSALSRSIAGLNHFYIFFDKLVAPRLSYKSTELAQCGPRFGHSPPVTEHVLPLPMHRLAPKREQCGSGSAALLNEVTWGAGESETQRGFSPICYFVINFTVMEASPHSGPRCLSTRNR